jgi:hypothetical protein
MALMKSRLSNKLRLSTLVLLTFVLLGSLVAYMKMRQVTGSRKRWPARASRL